MGQTSGMDQTTGQTTGMGPTTGLINGVLMALTNKTGMAQIKMVLINGDRMARIAQMVLLRHGWLIKIMARINGDQARTVPLIKTGMAPIMARISGVRTVQIRTGVLTVLLIKTGMVPTKARISGVRTVQINTGMVLMVQIVLTVH
jgi:hypothetical protein